MNNLEDDFDFETLSPRQAERYWAQFEVEAPDHFNYTSWEEHFRNEAVDVIRNAFAKFAIKEISEEELVSIVRKQSADIREYGFDPQPEVNRLLKEYGVKKFEF